MTCNETTFSSPLPGRISRRLGTLVILLSLPMLAGAQDEPAAAQPEAKPLPGLEAFVDGAVEAIMTEHAALPGITVSVVKDGEIILLKGYGLADVESQTPVDPSRSLFRIGSITKTFTGLAVMQLVDKGLIDLDEDINVYLKDFKVPEAFGEPITMRNLLAHRAGFEDAAAGHLFLKNADEVLPLGEYLEIRMPERVRPPGKSSTYTNYGISLAGHIVEVVSGQDFATYLDENIFEPLGMNHTTIREPLGAGHPHNISPDLESLIATGYGKGPDGKPLAKEFDFIGQVGPAGAISSTAEDMARYMMSRLEYDRYDGGRLVSPQMTARMRDRPYNDRPLVALDMAYAQGEGWFDGYRWRWHNGGTSTFFSDMTMYPELKLGVFVSTNSTDGGGLASGSIPKLIFEKYYPTKRTFTAPTPPADFLTRGQKYAGEYMPSRRSYTKLEKLSALAGTVKVSVDEEGYLVVAAGPNSTRFAEIEPGVFQTADPDPNGRGRSRHLYFYEDENGVPERISMSASDPIRISYFQSPSFFFLALGLSVFLALTTLLSAWRRAWRGLDQTGGGRWASRLAVIAAFAVLAVAGGLGITAASIAGGEIDGLLFNWPGNGLKTVLISVLVILVSLLGMLLTLIPAWREPGWNSWRRFHYTVFTLTLVMLAFAFQEWNLIGFKY
jgi:CubicO group peptidase (beta-lactamase class C family)